MKKGKIQDRRGAESDNGDIDAFGRESPRTMSSQRRGELSRASYPTVAALIPFCCIYRPKALPSSSMTGESQVPVRNAPDIVFPEDLAVYHFDSFDNRRQRSALCRFMPVIVVVEADDVVLAQVFAVLDLDDLKRDLAAVLEPVLGGYGDIGAFIRVHVVFAVPVRDPCRARYDDPVFAAMVMQLMGQFCAGIDLDPLDLVPVAFFEHRIGAPGPMNGAVDQVFLGFAFFELIHDLFDILCPVLAADERGIGRVDDDGILQADGRYQPLFRIDDGIVAVDIDHIAVYDIARGIALGNIVQRGPASHIGPADIGRDHRGPVGLFHDGIIDRDRVELLEYVLDHVRFPVRADMLVRISFRPCVQGRMMLFDLGQERFRFPDEDAAVPVIAAVSEICLGRFQVRLFHKGLDPADAVQARLRAAFARP